MEMWACFAAVARSKRQQAPKWWRGINIISICKRRVSFTTSPTPQEKSTHCIGQITYILIPLVSLSYSNTAFPFLSFLPRATLDLAHQRINPNELPFEWLPKGREGCLYVPCATSRNNYLMSRCEVPRVISIDMPSDDVLPAVFDFCAGDNPLIFVAR